MTDANGIPLSYTTFPGNDSEQAELHKNVESLKRKEGIVGKTIIVADKGLNSGDNMLKASEHGDGYVFSQKVRNAAKEEIAWILSESDYIERRDKDGTLVYKEKSHVGDFLIYVTSKLNGQKVQANERQKRVVFYSKDYRDKASYERDKVIAKAMQIIGEPQKYKKGGIGDAISYIKEIRFNKDGEIANNCKLSLDEQKIEEERKLDGYYMIVTNEINLSNEEIIEIYRGLWEIEETFSIIKGVLKIRPVFAKSLYGVHAHILVSYFALLILGLIQKVYLKEEDYTPAQLKVIERANKKKKVHKIKVEKKGELPMKQIVSFMRETNACLVGETYFMTKYSPIMDLIYKLYDISLDRHVLSEADIKKIFATDLQHKTATKN